MCAKKKAQAGGLSQAQSSGLANINKVLAWSARERKGGCEWAQEGRNKRVLRTATCSVSPSHSDMAGMGLGTGLRGIKAYFHLPLYFSTIMKIHTTPFNSVSCTSLSQNSFLTLSQLHPMNVHVLYSLYIHGTRVVCNY